MRAVSHRRAAWRSMGLWVWAGEALLNPHRAQINELSEKSCPSNVRRGASERPRGDPCMYRMAVSWGLLEVQVEGKQVLGYLLEPLSCWKNEVQKLAWTL